MRFPQKLLNFHTIVVVCLFHIDPVINVDEI